MHLIQVSSVARERPSTFSLTAAPLAPPRFRSRQVNDNDDVAAAGGGSHWSLLAYLRDENAFAHFDSAGGRNDAGVLLERRDPVVLLARAIRPEERF